MEELILNDTIEYNAKLWPASDLSNAEAAQVLRVTNSGLKPNLSRYGYRFVKPAFDIVASGAAIAVLLVPGLVLSAAICVKSPGAGPLYSQTRVGRLRKDGSYKLFRMWKFRSMVPNADAMLTELKDKNEATGPLFKTDNNLGVYFGRMCRSGTVWGLASSVFGTNLVQIEIPERQVMQGCVGSLFASVPSLGMAA